tara:strand:- start:883 stop:2496 length:1614 start_codon:yes stop_codon:yes gene_type:complete
MPVTEAQGSIDDQLAALRSDFHLYAPQCLKIKTKAGHLLPFKLNKAQMYIDFKLNEQLEKTGKVRALILKGRQQGCSTYVGGRFYHKASLRFGTSVYILTHEQKATENLFAMAERYHEHTPLQPKLGKSNAKEMQFVKLDGGYKVGTAGVKAGGRSGTIQLFHGSEVAFWPNDTDQFSGVVQSVPDEPGTEIILESTANGVTGEFYDRWQQAEQGIGEYIAIFVPWFWDPGYRKRPPEDFVLFSEKQHEADTMTEVEYAELHDLDDEQMYWRRMKIYELGPVKFMQEYPGTADEAFQTTGQDSFIKPIDVLKARKNKLSGVGPLVVGVDPSRYGDDKFSIAWRQGRKVNKVESKQKVETTEAAFWIKRIIDQDDPAAVFIDSGGGGAQIYDIVVSFGEKYADVMHLINFGGEPEEPVIFLEDGSERPGPKNRRAEMWMRSNDWLKQPGGADIPDEGYLQSEACAPNYRYDIRTQHLVLESKEQMRARKVRSPDDWDAIALTFASMVYDDPAQRQTSSTKKSSKRPRRSKGSNSWMGR